MLAKYCSEILASIGLGMDIVGIVLLFRYGAIGSDWIGKPTRLRMVYEQKDGDAERADDAQRRNEQRASAGAGIGLALAVTGFALQFLAQWM